MTMDKHYFQLKGEKAEKIVHDLAEKTFLVDWCFPNPRLPDGKELCDLLVIFDSIAIIWQIKDLKLDESGKYKKAEVDKNLRQLAGAARHMFELKSKIKLSNARRVVETFDPNTITEVFLISVLLGEGENYYSSLVESKGRNVHVFTRDFTEIALNELDTVSDFCAYLRDKERFFTESQKSIIVTGGEQEILAAYLRDGRTFEQFKNATNIYLDGSLWEGLLTEQTFVDKKKADKISYGWDSIINRAHMGTSQYEAVARELARPNRFERRYLSKVFMEAHVMAHEDEERDMLRRLMAADGVTYCFLFAEDLEEKRTRRQNMLAVMCYIARGKFLDNHKVVGVATEKKLRSTSSYDFVLLDMPTWSDEDQKKCDQLQKETGIFVNPKVSKTHEDEYPQ